MANLHEIVRRLDEFLNIGGIPDYPGAVNGLQLENGGEVRRVASAVDASLPIVREAVEREVDLLLVHHGLFWQGVQPLVGSYFEKIQAATSANLAIYSSHIPLDIHAEVGNNALLGGKIGLENVERFFDWKGIQLGIKGDFAGSLDQLVDTVKDAVGGEVVVGGGSPRGEVGAVGLITGGAGTEVGRMKELGVGTFITGEGPHWSAVMAEEEDINIIYAGHYATETFGVAALGAKVASEFTLEHCFLANPSGL